MKDVSLLPHFCAMICLQLAGCSTELVLNNASYGAVTFGDNLVEVKQAFGENPEVIAGEIDCHFISLNAYPHIKFMVESGAITRADALSAEIKNSLGVKRGDELTAVQRRYPSAQLRPHKYDPTGHYLIFDSVDGKRALVLEAQDGRITDIRGGLKPSVEYVEGCL